MADKSIYDFTEYTGTVEGDEQLLISKTNSNGKYQSYKYTVWNLERDISAQSVQTISREVSDYVDQLSAVASCSISEISNFTEQKVEQMSAQVSGVIDLLSNQVSAIIVEVSSETSSAISSLSAFGESMSASISDYNEKMIGPLRVIQGLSTLNYYTYIGDDISKISGDARLSAISGDVLWFDTSDEDKLDTVKNLTFLNNLQYQIYRLNMQMKDVYRMSETGIIPGTVTNNHKEQLITLVDKLKIPDDILSTDYLVQVNIYGPTTLRNSSRYYITFNPAGFDYKISTEITFGLIPNGTSNTVSSCVLTCISADWIFNDESQKWESLQYPVTCSLSVETIPFNATISNSVVYDIQMMSEIKTEIKDTISYDQDDINEVIYQLSCYANHLSNNTDKIDLSVGTNYESEDYGYITYDGTYTTKLSTSECPPEDWTLSIYGDDSCDYQAYYWALLNETKKIDLPLNTQLHWFFLSSGVSVDEETGEKVEVVQKVPSISVMVYDPDAEEGDEDKYGQVDIVNSIDSVGFVTFTLGEGTTANDVAKSKVSLYAESLVDNSISAVKEIQFCGKKPSSTGSEPTVNAVCAKLGTSTEFGQNKTTLYNGEIVFFTDKKKFAVYLDGSFIESGSSSSSSGESVTKEQIKDLNLEYLTFQDQDISREDSTGSYTTRYKLDINDKGNVNVTLSSSVMTQATIDSTNVGNSYVTHLLQLGKIYCGGKKVTRTNPRTAPEVDEQVDDMKLVSHDFVEIINGSNEDINLDNIYLMYYTTDTDDTFKVATDGEYWEYIKLSGVIKAGGTYLIRGACANKHNDAFWKINNYDIQWRKKSKEDEDDTRTGNLIRFSQNNSTFHLIIGKENVDLIATDKISPFVSQTVAQNGFIDLFGFGNGAFSIGNSIDLGESFDCDSSVFIRRFPLDPSKQAHKAYKSRTEATYWDFMSLKTQERKQIGQQVQYYFDDNKKISFKPGSSSENHNFFTDKSKFRSDKPNMVTIGFGIQATQSNLKKASRCFNWVSIGYYDEFVCYHKVGQDEEYKEYSITEDSTSIDSNNKDWYAPFHKFYDRLRWTASDGTLVTTHKVIIHESLEAGEYEYYIGRDGDSNYVSESFKFTVNSDSQVQKFSFIQTTDQQGFNWQEYQAWKASCWTINEFTKNNQFNFTINTGDIAQSGNRPNEWLDYHDGRKYISSKEEMYTVGNNDLCGRPDCELTDGEDNTSKFNLVNVIRYFTFELDPYNIDLNGNSNYFSTVFGSTFPLYSLYSFTYGNWHFVSLPSEIRSFYAYATDIDWSELSSSDNRLLFSKTLNSQVENWFIKDLLLYKNTTSTADLLYNCQNCIVYMHEMPFTITTGAAIGKKFNSNPVDNDRSGNIPGSITSEQGSGCHLNIEGKGFYRISRLLRKLGIKLVMGGHKHTYSISKPIYDAPYDENGQTIYPNDLLDLSSDPFLSTDCSFDSTHRPIVEIPTDGTHLDTPLSRFHEVQTFTAPTYVMCQATGFKLVSNKELPPPLPTTEYPPKDNDLSSGKARIPWLLSYFPASGIKNLTSLTAYAYQYRPMFIKYDLESGEFGSELSGNIGIKAYQINGIYNVTGSGVYTAFNINNQLHDYRVSCMTISSEQENDPTLVVTSDPKDYMSTLNGNTLNISCQF